MSRSSVWNEEIALHTARLLFDSGSYLLNPEKPKEEWYLWKSGIRAPCYCNCRYLNGTHLSYETCATYIETIVRLKFPEAQILVGLASAGIPWSARIASRLTLPMSFVRSTQKAHGIGKLVEGNPERNLKAVIIDDLCGSGDSIYNAIQALEWEYDIKTLGFITITNWCFDHMWNTFDEIGMSEIYSLTSYPYLLDVGQQLGKITSRQSEVLSSFYRSPKKFEWPNDFFLQG